MRLLLFFALSAYAQAPAPGQAAAPPGQAAPGQAETRPGPSANLAHALDLPIAARSLRNAGVPETDVKAALDAAKNKGLGAAETTDTLEAAATAVKEHGPVDNFGAFVQAKLDEGLRGKDLAAAIQAEHAARGKSHGASGEHGPDAEHGASGDHGPDASHGKSADHADARGDNGSGATAEPRGNSSAAGTHSRPDGDHGMSASRPDNSKSGAARSEDKAHGKEKK